MLNRNEQKLVEVREKTAEILEDLMISQKLALQAIEACDSKSFDLDANNNQYIFQDEFSNIVDYSRKIHSV